MATAQFSTFSWICKCSFGAYDSGRLAGEAHRHGWWKQVQHFRDWSTQTCSRLQTCTRIRPGQSDGRRVQKDRPLFGIPSPSCPGQSHVARSSCTARSHLLRALNDPTLTLYQNNLHRSSVDTPPPHAIKATA